MIVGQDGQPRSAGKSVLCDPASDRLRHPPQFSIGATLDPIGKLQFQRNVLRPALGALDKTVVESGHGSWGIYTKVTGAAGVCRPALRPHCSQLLRTSQNVIANPRRSSQGFFCCGFSASATALRNCSTAETDGACRQSFTT